MNLGESARSVASGEATLSLGGRAVLDPPVEAFRVWSVWMADDVPRLRSLVNPFHAWAAGKLVEARCAVAPEAHAAPHPGCRCGVHGLGSWARLEPYLHGDGPESRPIAGRVALWGAALSGRWGWRAEFGRLLAIIPLPGDGGLAMDVASIYGAPITPLTGELLHGA